MPHKTKKPLVEIRCQGCGRTQHVRRLEVCDGYTCSLGSCRLNPDFKIPEHQEGFICELVMCAAGGFSGYRIRVASDEDLQAVARARAIRDAGISLLSQAAPVN
jgi:hypothetical protein